MTFPRVYIILSLAVFSFAQLLDVKQLFEVDEKTNNEGGCGYVGHERLNRLITDAFQLADSLIAAIDEALNPDSPRYIPVRRLIKAYFKSTDDLNLAEIKGI